MKNCELCKFSICVGTEVKSNKKVFECYYSKPKYLGTKTDACQYFSGRGNIEYVFSRPPKGGDNDGA